MEVAVPVLEVYRVGNALLFRLATQGEVKATDIGTVAGKPFIRPVRLHCWCRKRKLMADPRVIAPRVTVAPLTAMPTGVLVTVVVVPPDVICADAVMLVAPAELMSAEFILMKATPLAFVNAVAEVGVNVTRLACCGESYNRIMAPALRWHLLVSRKR